MKKTLYSLMLSDDVVREVDLLAHKRGTNRSNLINQILAEYLGMTTPQRRINDVFQAIEEAVAPYGQLVPFFTPNDLTMSLKSSLEYKYRPTVKYVVELYESGKESMGEISVIFRTQSAAIIWAKPYRLSRTLPTKSSRLSILSAKRPAPMLSSRKSAARPALLKSSFPLIR